MKIILASTSPRRKELLEMIGINFETKTSEVDETLVPNLSIGEQSERLAYIKAKAVFDGNIGDRAVIGADTLVVKDDKIYGKPKNREEALSMLRDLKNTDHIVITSVCVISEVNGEYKEQICHDITEVHLKDMTDEEINRWLDTGKAYDKAGAYAIQGEFSVYVEKMNGNFYSVMGLPIHKVYDMLKNI